MCDIITSFKDISQLPVDKQLAFLEKCCYFVNSIKDKKDRWDKVAFTTDTHGDFTALLTSLVESGVVKLENGAFLFYDVVKEKFLTDYETVSYKPEEDDDKIIEFFRFLEEEKMKIILDIVKNSEFHKILESKLDENSIYVDTNDIVNTFIEDSKKLSKEEADKNLEIAKKVEKLFFEKWKETLKKNIHGEFLFKIISFIENKMINLYSINGINDFMKFLFKDVGLDFNYLEICDLREALSSNLCIIPTPFVNEEYSGTFYHLGDVVDRGKESIMSLLFLEKLCDAYKEKYPDKELPIHIVVGNHEAFNTGRGGTHIQLMNGAEAYDLYKHIIARMLHKGYMSSGYTIGKDENLTLITHSAFLESDFIILINSFYNAYKFGNEEEPSDDNIEAEYLISIKKEFSRKKMQELYERMINFLKAENKAIYEFRRNSCKFFNQKSERILTEKIEKSFSLEELVNIRTIMLDAMLKMEINDNGKIICGREIQGSLEFEKFLVNNLLVKADKMTNKVVSIGFWQRIINNDRDLVVCNECLGHEPLQFISQSVPYKGINGTRTVNFFDTSRSYGILENTPDYFCAGGNIVEAKLKPISIPMTAYYEKNNNFITLNKPYCQSSYLVQRHNLIEISSINEINSLFFRFNQINNANDKTKQIYFNGSLFNYNKTEENFEETTQKTIEPKINTAKALVKNEEELEIEEVNEKEKNIEDDKPKLFPLEKYLKKDEEETKNYITLSI